MSDRTYGNFRLRRYFRSTFSKGKPVHVIVEYGKPIDPKSLDKDTRKKIGSHCQGVIAEMLEKNNPQI